MQEGHHLSSPGPPHSPNLEVQPVASGGGREDPGIMVAMETADFPECCSVWEWRDLVAEAYWAPGLQALPFLGR